MPSYQRIISSGASITPTLEQLQLMPVSQSQQFIIDTVNQQAGRVRASFLTVIPGQEITYMLKAQDARAYMSASMATTGSVDGSQFPWIAQEAAFASKSLDEVAEDILTTEAQWQVIGSYVEGLRRGAITNIKSVSTVPEMLAISTTIPWPTP